MKTLPLVLLGFLAGCAGTESAASTATVTGRIVTRRAPFTPESFEFVGFTYQDRRLLIDPHGGVADAAVYLEGRTVPAWDSGKVVQTFGHRQFEPRISFVSPSRPVEIGDTRDEKRHELVVNLKDLENNGLDRIHSNPERPQKDGKPDRVCFTCPEGRWKREGKPHARGRTFEVTFDRPVLVPLDWD
jgi:hypothetical protein